MTHIGDCCTCAKFRHECPNGVCEPTEDGKPDWDGSDGGCTYWISAKCGKCRHIRDNGKHNRGSTVCAEGVSRSLYFYGNGQCQQFAPKVSQTTLEASQWE